MPYDYPIISADSHITEPPDCYIDRIDPAYRDRAPRMVDGGERGDLFEIPGMRFTSTSTSGAMRSVFISTSRSVPPASTRADPPAFDNRVTAALTVPGAS